MKILLIDDDAFLRDMYVTKFSESGDTVEGAQDGAEALRKISTGAYDVVLLDMIMPGMSGIDFLKAAKDIDAAKTAKYIVLSNQGEDADQQAAKDLGAIGYIIKAETVPSEVVAKVHKLVS